MGRFALLRIPLFPTMGPLMQGLHAFEPTTRTVIDLESFVPDDHLLRDVDRLLDPPAHSILLCGGKGPALHRPGRLLPNGAGGLSLRHQIGPTSV